MKNRKTLKERIIQSVFVYETKKITMDTILKAIIFIVSSGIILVFGGVIADMIIESEIGVLLHDFIKESDFSRLTLLELMSVIFGEIPQWLFWLYITGLILGCILTLSIIRNWKSISHKIRSLFHYWFNL